MTNQQRQVREFMERMGIPIGQSPGIREVESRKGLIREEFEELIEAMESGDLLAGIDALCDLQYVLIGCAIAWGIDLEPFFDEVHRANMRKLGGKFDPVTGKILKPDAWEPPDHKSVLASISDRYEGKVIEFLESKGITEEQIAQLLRRTWTGYAKDTLGDNAPPGFTRSWEETGNWGRNGNLIVARAFMEVLTSALEAWNENLQTQA